MRKIISLLVLFGLFLTGCTQEEESTKNVYQIYYMDRNENHIDPVEYEARNNSADTEELVWELLEQLSIQIEEIEYQPVITRFTVKDCLIREGQVTLNFSEEYKLLEPYKEVLVRAAIVKTLTQLEGVELVNIQVNGSNLTDSLGETIGVMSADTFIDNTGADVKKYEQATLTLYFANASGDKLIKVNRTLRYNTNISLEKLVVEQLLAGPVATKDQTLTILPTLNPQTKIISINIKDGICYVNLDRNFLPQASNVSPEVAIYSLVNSLTELPNVSKVQIAVERETEVIYGEKYMLSTLFERNLELIQTEETKEE